VPTAPTRAIATRTAAGLFALDLRGIAQDGQARPVGTIGLRDLADGAGHWRAAAAPGPTSRAWATSAAIVILARQARRGSACASEAEVAASA